MSGVWILIAVVLGLAVGVAIVALSPRLRLRMVDGLLAERPQAALAGLVVILLVGWMMLGVWLAGAVPTSRMAGRGPIVLTSESSLPHVLEWKSELALTEAQDGASDGKLFLGQLTEAEAAWWKTNFCKARLGGAVERAARAWRVRNNPELCTPRERWSALRPLNIKFGLIGDLMAIVGLAGLARAGWWLVARFYHAGVGYRRLFASEYRVERQRARAKA